MGDARLEGVRRFDDRVDKYSKYRPDYPREIVEHLRRAARVPAPARVADVGSGTGKLAEVFLAAGDVVLGIEPNRAMLDAARRELAGRPRYHGVAGRAEALPLCETSVDAVTAGQAYHWFDADAARREFMRVLRPEGVVALVWNNRKEATGGFLQEYEEMLQRLCPEYARIGNKHYEEDQLATFFGAEPKQARFDHAQHFDREGLRGRLLSSSYVPAEGAARDAVLRESDVLFERYSTAGQVAMEYDTMLFYGTLG